MITIPFTKAHGARNDFLLTWHDQFPGLLPELSDESLAAAAVAICDRHTGAGADGWLLVSKPLVSKDAKDADGAIELWNSDGSRSAISGNGTRCAAAFLIEAGHKNETVRIMTGAGLKHLRALSRDGHRFSFVMNMGTARVEELHTTVFDHDAAILDVGNPQCAVFVENFDLDWRTLGAAIERHPRFPNRTNVSFIRILDEHSIDVRFFERGAGETMSSGTGSTGAAAASMARGLVRSPVRVLTPAGPLDLQSKNGEILLAGPAEIVTTGEFYWDAV